MDAKVVGHALLLSFKETNITREIREVKSITKLLEDLNFSTKNIFLDSDRFEEDFQQFLRDDLKKPRLIYITSHGGPDWRDNLVLSG